MYKLAVFASHPIQYQAPLFKAMSESGEIDLKVYFASDFGAKKEEYDPEFGKKIKWDIPLLDGYKYEFLSGKLALPKILIRKKENYDAVIVLGWNSLYNWLIFFAGFLSGTPVFLRGENPLNQELLKTKGLKLFIKKMIFGWLFKRISAFLYIGEENKKFYEYYGAAKEKLFFAPYAVDNDRFFAQAEKLKPRKDELKSRLGISLEKAVILFVGKLIAKKRPMDLLRAYAGIKNDNKALVFVGEGKLRDELINFVEMNGLKDVHFAGFKNQTEIGEYYALADVFVLPSGIGETWGLVVNEAMCFGLPVVVSNVVGCGPDLVFSGKNGEKFGLGDIAALAGSIEKTIAAKSAASKDIIKSYSYTADVGGILKALIKTKR